MRKIIGICGLINSGKDTAANFLCEKHNFQRDSFASTVKDMISIVFGWDRSLLEGNTHESRLWREQVDSWWAERLNIPHLTPRWVLQYWATEMCRSTFHDDIWVACLESRLQKIKKDTVITDVRFPNELSAIRKAGGIIVRIKRGDYPVWWPTAILANNGDQGSVEKLKEMGIHESERSLAGYPLDSIIENDYSILEFHNQLNSLVESLELNPPASKANLALEVCVDNWHKLS